MTPRPNRLAWFDGRLTHGVLDAENHIPGRRLPKERSLRLAVAINLWSNRPKGARLFAEAGAYRRLAKRRPAALQMKA